MAKVLNPNRFMSEVKRRANTASYKATTSGLEMRSIGTENFFDVSVAGFGQAEGDLNNLVKFVQAGSDRFQEPVKLIVGADMGKAPGRNPNDGRFAGSGSTETDKGVFYSAFVEFPEGKGKEQKYLRPAFDSAMGRLEEFVDKALNDPNKTVRWVLERIAKETVSRARDNLRNHGAIDSRRLLNSIGYKTLI